MAMHRQTPSTHWLRGLFIAALMLTCLHAVRAADEFLDPEVAFTLTAKTQGERSVELSFTAAPGYYLYGEQFKVVASGATLGVPVRPPGKIKFDETFQKDVESYRDTVRIVVPVQQAPARFRLIATNQGCADKGLCYPPMERAIDVSLTGFGGDGKLRVYDVDQTLALVAAQVGAIETAGSVVVARGGTAGQADAGASSSDAAGLDAALRGGRFWSIVGVFFAAGLLL
ncbi:MAG: protein-disulfide reductase DsbD N-terminal domain-containing protein, partial [Burkholderiaceae bacterium]